MDVPRELNSDDLKNFDALYVRKTLHRRYKKVEFESSVKLQTYKTSLGKIRELQIIFSWLSLLKIFQKRLSHEFTVSTHS